MKKLAVLLLFAGYLVARAETPVPATAEFTFDPSAPGQIKTVTSGDASYFKSVQTSGGKVVNGWWQVTSAAPFGQGRLQFEIDRSKLAGDLALVVQADWQADTDVAVQLYDAEGRALALDLFGETRRNARTVGTDTFVIPLDRYPAATSIMIRRLSGDLRIMGCGLFPVLSELTAKADNEVALAAQLGVILSPRHWSFTEASKEFSGAAGENPLGQVHILPSLEQTNAIGAAILKEPNYPAYRPLTNGLLVPPKISASNTTDFIVKNALRTIALRSGGTEAKPFMTSSDGVCESLLKNKCALGFMSLPLSSAEKEDFFRTHGHPIVELRFAHDALEILVNARNPVRSITVPQLDAVYGRELRAGAPAAITAWSALGGGGQAIKVVGGGLNWGTTRTFQQLVLKGGEFRKDMLQLDVVYNTGVEKAVAEDSDAIGFATLRPRNPSVRALAVAANSGEAACLATADNIYSGKYPLQRMFFSYVAAPSLGKAGGFQNELINLLLSDVGQTLVARAGSLPLMASEVVTERARLGLPQ